MNKALQIALAVFVTLVAVVVTMVAAQMAAASSTNRGGSQHDKDLIVALSVVMVLAVHLIPAISRRWVSWIVWFGCLICALFSHLTFFTHADLRANDSFAQTSARTIGTERQLEMTKEALNQITARPVTTVANELSMSKEKRERAALNIELKQAQKAEALRDKLVQLSEAATESKVGGAVNPVFKNLQAVYGWTAEGISVGIYLFNAVCLELFGALIWFLAFQKIHEAAATKSGEVFDAVPVATQAVTAPVTRTTPVATRGKAVTEILAKSNATTQDKGNATQAATTRKTTEESSATTPASHDATTAQSNDATTATPVVTFEESIGATQHISSSKTDPEDEQLVTLKYAVQSGKCKPTVNSIREFLGCSQNRAVLLNRLVKA